MEKTKQTKHKLRLLLPLLAVFLIGVTPIATSVVSTFTSPAYADDTSDDKGDDKGDDKDKDKDDDKSKDDKGDGEKSEAASSGDYSKLQIPSRIATAYHDAYIDAYADSSGDKAKVLNSNINTILDAQNNAGNVLFSNVGALYGSVSLSNSSSTSNITQLAGTDKEYIVNNLGGPSGAGVQYWQFGQALSDLNAKAQAASPSGVGSTSVMSGLNGLASIIGNVGISFLQNFSPAPLVLALHDSSILDTGKYENNYLVKLVNSTGPMKGFIQLFGEPAPGFPQVSMAEMIAVVIIIVTLGLSAVMVIFNGRNFGMAFRHTLIKILAISLAIPVAAVAYDKGLSAVKSVVDSKKSNIQDETVSTNLALADWAQNARFGVPQGMVLHVQDGRFVLSRDDIRKINLFTAKMSGVISEGEYNSVINSPSADADSNVIKKVSKHIKTSVSENKNKTTIKWADAMRGSDGADSKGGADSARRPFYTDTYNNVAKKLGSGSLIDDDGKIDKDANPSSSGYLAYASLYSTDGGSTFMMSPGIDYGLTPVAAFNIMNTTFDAKGFGVKSNLENPTVATIAPAANTYNALSGSEKGQTAEESADAMKSELKTPTLIVSVVISLTLLFAGLSALVRIISAGFGGMFSGGMGASVGSASGAGTLFGGILALIFGVVGLSLLIVVMQGLVDFLWGIVMDAVVTLGGNAFDVMPDGILDSIRSWPLGLGVPLADMLTSLLRVLLSIVALIFMPSMIKVPITAFGTWVASFPSLVGEKFQQMSNKFTGDYRAGGNSGGGHMSQAINKASHSMSGRSAAMRTGAAMAGGAILRSVIDKKTAGPSSHSDSKSVNDHGTDGKDTETEGGTTTENKLESTGRDTQQQTAESVTEEQRNSEAKETDANSVDSEASMTNQNDSDHSESEGGDRTTEGSHDANSQTIKASDSLQDKSMAKDEKKDKESKASEKHSAEKKASKESSVKQDAKSESSDSLERGAAAAAAVGEMSDKSQSVNAMTENVEQGSVNADEKSVNTENKAGDNAHLESKQVDGNIAESVNSEVNAPVTADKAAEKSVTADKKQGDRKSEPKQATKSDGVTKSNTKNTNVDKSSVDASSKISSPVTESIKASGGKSMDGKTGSQSASKKPTTSDTRSKRDSVLGRINESKTPASAKGGKAVGVKTGLKDVGKNILGQAKGEVSNREAAAMGMAHMAAGAVGAQGVTQHGVDNVNARNGKRNGVSTKTSGTNGNNAQANAKKNKETLAHLNEAAAKAREDKTKKPNVNSVRNDIERIRAKTDKASK